MKASCLMRVSRILPFFSPKNEDKMEKHVLGKVPKACRGASMPFARTVKVHNRRFYPLEDVKNQNYHP